MNDKILEAREEFNRVIDFGTEEAPSQEIHCVEHEVFRMPLRLGRILLGLHWARNAMA
jgi:hypothetical protein